MECCYVEYQKRVWKIPIPRIIQLSAKSSGNVKRPEFVNFNQQMDEGNTEKHRLESGFEAIIFRVERRYIRMVFGEKNEVFCCMQG
ncbi:hypothetical protein TNCV_3147241 [Trichonephila clavipes]|nr:hypothetical protein TNCV_3147241 [Trichonephila clavipes]